MSRANIPFFAFNQGEIGERVLLRTRLEKYPATAEIMENWLPEVEGEMFMRPGMIFDEAVAGNAFTIEHSFVFNLSQTYMLALSGNALRIRQNGSTIVRQSVSSTISGGDFADLSAWTDISTGGGSASASGGKLVLTSDGTSVAGVRQQVSTGSPDVIHGLDLHVTRGSVIVSVGSTAGDDDLLKETTARTGRLSLSFTPTGSSYWVEIKSREPVERQVESVAISPSGDLVLATPWAESQLRDLRFHQEGDVVYVVSGSDPVYRIERHGSAAWAVVEMEPKDGPFDIINTDQSLTVTPSVTTGNGQLTASSALFRSGHVGALWQITHTGQKQTAKLAGDNQFTGEIKVTGVGSSRAFTYTLAGTFSATVTLQRSIGNNYSWTDYQTQTSPVTDYSVNDGLDNQIVYYRLIIKSGDYTSGSVDATLDYSGGVTTGIVRITAVNSDTNADMEVIEGLGDTTPTNEWAEGAWSQERGFPATIAEFDGRMWFGKSGAYYGTYANTFESFKVDGGDSSAITRSIATGDPKWIIGLQRLVLGTGTKEYSIRSTAFDEPITITNLTRRTLSERGSANVQAIPIDTYAYFVSRTHAIQKLAYNIDFQGYRTTDGQWALHKTIGEPSILQMAVSRYPDTRVWMVRGDGQVIVLLSNAEHNAEAFARIVTDGVIESVAVEPVDGDGEDIVRFVVKRTINGVEKRYFEHLAPMDVTDASMGQFADSCILYNGAATSTITGLDHLEGEEVVVWADGASHPNRTVSGGQITLERSASKVCVGLGYEARYKVSRLAYAAQAGTALGQKKRPVHITLFLRNSVSALWYGQSLNDNEMDRIGDRTPTGSYYDTGPGLRTFETERLPMPKGFGTDARVCLKAKAPFGPVTVQGYVLGFQINERVP